MIAPIKPTQTCPLFSPFKFYARFIVLAIWWASLSPTLHTCFYSVGLTRLDLMFLMLRRGLIDKQIKPDELIEDVLDGGHLSVGLPFEPRAQREARETLMSAQRYAEGLSSDSLSKMHKVHISRGHHNHVRQESYSTTLRSCSGADGGQSPLETSHKVNLEVPQQWARQRLQSVSSPSIGSEDRSFFSPVSGTTAFAC